MNRDTYRAILSTIKLQMLQSFSRSMFRFTIIATPIFTGLLMGFIYLDKSSEDFISYAIIGACTTTMWVSIAFSSAGDINRERYMGALQQVFNAPQDFYNIMLGKVLGNTILGGISMIGCFSFVSLVFKVPIRIEAPIHFCVIFLILICSYIFLGLMLSGLLAISRQTRVLMNCMDFPILILTGSAFPISVLPAGVRILSYLLSPTYAIHLMRLCISGNVYGSEFSMYMIGLIITSIVYYILSKIFYRVIDYRARINATLEVV